MFKTIGTAFKIILFFLNLWKEKDEKKSQEKSEIGKEIVDAFKETDKTNRASKLNSAVGRIDRM